MTFCQKLTLPIDILSKTSYNNLGALLEEPMKIEQHSHICMICSLEAKAKVEWTSEELESICPICGNKTVGKTFAFKEVKNDKDSSN